MASTKMNVKASEKDVEQHWGGRTSLFDVAIDTAQSLNMKSLNSRIVIISKLNLETSDRSEIGDYLERYFKSISSNALQQDCISGLLLLYQQHAICIIESSENILLEVIQEVESIDRQRMFFTNSKIVIYTSNISSRLFGMWSYCLVNVPSVRMDDQKSADNLELVVSEILMAVYSLSQQLAKQPKSAGKSPVDKTIEQHASQLIPPDLMEKFLQCNDTLSPLDYQRKYILPLHVTLDSEVVWPISSNMHVL